MPSIVAISGTSRPNNFTSRALSVVTARLTQLGAAVQALDAVELRLDFPGRPETEDAVRLRQAVKAADGVVLATPEYHGTFAAMTKLVLENMGFPSALSGKPVALVGVAQGRIGAIKSLEHLRGACAHMGAIVVPSAVSLAGVQRAFDANGALTDAGARAALEGVAQTLLDFIKNYVCPRVVLEAIVRDNPDAPWAGSV